MTSPTQNSVKAAPRLAAVKRPVLWAGLLMITAIFLRSLITGRFGQIGIDGDDVMRLVQIRDYLAGQSWFNTDQLRLGVIGGTDMHWSRLVDLPIIVLTQFFSLFMSGENALMTAASVWPPLTAGLFIYAIAKAAKFYNAGGSDKTLNSTSLVFTLILLAFFVVQFFRFEPGAIDHHNVQMGLIALAMAGGLDPLQRFRTHFIAGAAAALSVAIGTEVYIFAGVICAYMAINWFIRGQGAARAAQGFGLGLSAVLALAFFSTISPSEYGMVKCDSLSLITLSAGAAGGLGLAIVAFAASRKTIAARAIALAAVGALCLIIFAVQGPGCMANPLSDIPDDVTRLWLNEVQEARPLWKIQNDWLAVIPLTLGPALLGLYVVSAQLKQERSRGIAWSPRWLVLGLLLSAGALSVYQIRFNTFSYVFALIPLAAWTAGIYARGKRAAATSENGSNITYIAALALSVPLVWLLPAAIAQSQAPSGQTAQEAAAAQVGACYSKDVMEGLNTLPLGTIASTSNGGAEILQYTAHRTLSGNYHRNIKGISAQIHLATSAPEKALKIIKEAGVDYVHFCKVSPETDNLVKENESGLYARLRRGEVPAFLTPQLSLEDGGVIIYKVN